MSITSRIWPLVIVGKGSSAAYYLCTVDTREYPSILAIGDGDAWSAAVRGHHGSQGDPTLYINHPLHLITHFNETIPEFSTVKVDRLDWAERNKVVFTRCGVRLYDKAKVKEVSEAPTFPPHLTPDDSRGPSGFRITLENGKTIYAYKVVMAAGAGGHRVPDMTVRHAKKQWPTQVIDLDEFARLDRTHLQGKSVIVMGPNAAIDAVQKALHYQCKIYWLLGPNDKPPVLATQPTVQTAIKNNKEMIQIYKNFEFKNKIGNEISVKLDTGKILSGHYFVYGMGQTGESVDTIHNDIKRKLTPIYDKNQYLGAGSDTILGFEAIGTGLKSGFEVVGAMSAQVGRALLNSKEQSLKFIADSIGETRRIKIIHEAIHSSNFPTKPFLFKDINFLANRPRIPLLKHLQKEVDFILNKHSNHHDLKKGLDMLVGLLLAYQAAKTLDKTNLQRQLNQVTHDLPKGTVADSGQLTSIRSAMGAKHTTVPTYAGTQSYTGNNINNNSSNNNSNNGKKWVQVESVPGDVNFSVDNATLIQITLSVRYPFISDKFLNEWVMKLMTKRHFTGTGFKNEEVKGFHDELFRENCRALQNLNKL
ncbi:MAG: hypothetical protein H6975_07255 [Gammaproteobacteria bacterium]|nr:hypothetical protein [Gammaproteobacteria bacterium]